MNKKTIFASLLCLLSVLTFLYINNRIKIIDLTSIDVETENNLDTEKVKVYQGYYTINRENDAEIFDNKNDVVVYDGAVTCKIKTEYGENDFLVTYDNKYYFQFRQFCTNDNDHFRYNLKVFKKLDQVYLKIDVTGGIKFEKPMNLISDAGKLRCNGTINDKKGVYNGIELRENKK